MNRFLNLSREVALITPNARGGWSLLLPGAGVALGNYDTPHRPSEVALINGYTPRIEEVRDER